MAYNIVDGVHFYIATQVGSPISVTAISNANPAVVSASGHGMTAKTPFITNLGWEEINQKVLRVANPASGTFEIDGLDTTNVSLFPAGSGGGTVTPVTGWTEIPQILDANPSGGEQQYIDVEPLAMRYGFKIPSRVSGAALEFTLGFDASLAVWPTLQAISDANKMVAIKREAPGGSVSYGYGYFFLSQMPTDQKGDVQKVRAALTTVRPFTTYAA